MSGDPRNVIGPEILRFDPEIMTANLKKKWSQKYFFIYIYKNGLWPGDLINVIRTEILRSVPEIMDREFEKKWSKKINFLFL